MQNVSDPDTLDRLIDRLNAVAPDSPRKWGTMSPGEMLCHLGDATTSVLTPTSSEGATPRRFLKWFALRVPLRWPRGLVTPSTVDPHHDGTKPADFAADKQRAIEGLRSVAAAGSASLQASHGAFGPMSVADWHRWAYLHTDHHLRQFGL